jgi:hypothetical protein
LRPAAFCAQSSIVNNSIWHFRTGKVLTKVGDEGLERCFAAMSQIWNALVECRLKRLTNTGHWRQPASTHITEEGLKARKDNKRDLMVIVISRHSSERLSFRRMQRAEIFLALTKWTASSSISRSFNPPSLLTETG